AGEVARLADAAARGAAAHAVHALGREALHGALARLTGRQLARAGAGRAIAERRARTLGVARVLARRDGLAQPGQTHSALRRVGARFAGAVAGRVATHAVHTGDARWAGHVHGARLAEALAHRVAGALSAAARGAERKGLVQRHVADARVRRALVAVVRDV